MPNREEIEKLRERVRSATGPDREIDLALVLIFQLRPGDIPTAIDELPRFTSSIDAALGLLWRLWPHANFELSCAANEGSYCLLAMPTDGGEIHLGDAEGNTPCLTILAAVLTALLSGSEA